MLFQNPLIKLSRRVQHHGGTKHPTSPAWRVPIKAIYFMEVLLKNGNTRYHYPTNRTNTVGEFLNISSEGQWLPLDLP